MENKIFAVKKHGKFWATVQSLEAQGKLNEVKKKLKDTFLIDYDATDAKKKLIKEMPSLTNQTIQ